MKKYRFPASHSSDPEEKYLSALFYNYIRSENPSYDPKFLNLLREKYNFKFQHEKIIKIQKEIALFIKNHGYLPSQVSLNSNEKRLSQYWGRFSNIHGDCYDESFSNQYKKVPTFRQHESNKNALEIISFYEKTGIPPSKVSKDPVSHFLGVILARIRSGKAIVDENIKQQILNLPNRYEIKRQNSGLPVGIAKKSNGKFQVSICHRYLGTFNTLDEATSAMKNKKAAN
jgi:hypothetical protein